MRRYGVLNSDTHQSQDRFRFSRLIFLGILIGSLILSACGEDASTDTTAGGDGDGQSEGETEERVFRLWHFEDPRSAMGIAYARAMEILEENNPGVTVEFEEKGFEQMRQTGNMVLSSNEAPDLLEFNKGNSSTGLLVADGLIDDLTDVVEEYGWDDLVSPSLATTAKYSEDGIMGGDRWYGVSTFAEFVMVYYNADAFADQGLEVPTTLEELEAVLDSFVEAGETPVAMGAAEYPAQHLWYQLALTESDRDFVNDFQLYNAQIDFHNPAFEFAGDRLTEWVDRGYISQDSIGLRAEDMGTAFISGDYPILISGTWWYGRFIDEITDFEWGTFLFPGSDLYVGSGGNNWVVPTGASNKDLAHEFIDITMSPEIQNLMGNSGGIPVAADPESITDPKARELVDRFIAIDEGDGLGFYPDWPVPGFYDELVANIQELMSGQSTSDEILDALGSSYEAHFETLDR